jgi:hypothetical protein
MATGEVDAAPMCRTAGLTAGYIRMSSGASGTILLPAEHRYSVSLSPQLTRLCPASQAAQPRTPDLSIFSLGEKNSHSLLAGLKQCSTSLIFSPLDFVAAFAWTAPKTGFK